MKNTEEEKKPGSGTTKKILAIVVAVVVIGVVIAVEYPHLAPKPVKQQSLAVYPGPAGPANSEHLLGGCVIAEANTAGLTPSQVSAENQFVAYMLSPEVQFTCEQATGFIPISTHNVTGVPSIYSSSNATVHITYFTSIGSADYKTTEKLISNFESKYPNIQISATDESATNIVTNVEANINAGKTAPIVMSIDNLDVGILAYGQYQGASYLANMTDYKQVVPTNVIQSVTNLAQTELSIFHAIPFITQIINTPLVWVDMTALNSIGVTHEPQNYTALYNDAKALDKKYGRGMINFQGHGGASTPTELYQWFVQYGGNPVVFNDTHDIQAMYYIYNLSKYFTPEYKTSYWATYKGLAANKYSMMDYQWPGSVNLKTVGMNTSAVSGSNSVLNVSIKAISSGVFIRDPVPWISQWQIFMDNAWTSLITSGHSQNYSTIAHALSTANRDMYNYLLSNYNYTVAHDYEMGMYKPVTA